MKMIKKVLAIVLSIALVLGMSSISFAEGENGAALADVVLDGGGESSSSMIGTYTAPTNNGEATDSYKYLGYVSFLDLVPEMSIQEGNYRYLVMTYTGDISRLRFQFVHIFDDNTQKLGKPIWFNSNVENEPSYFVAAGGDIPLVGDNTTIVIDLLNSVDAEDGTINLGWYNSGLFMHCDQMVTYGNGEGITISDAYLTNNISGTEENSTEVTTETPVVIPEEIVLDGVDGECSFIGEYTVGNTAGYRYLGYVTTKSATSDYKYLKIKYIGDIKTLRLEFNREDDSNDCLTWFASDQAAHFVTVDGSDIVLVAETETECVIDLEASGIDIGEFVGFHVHYLDQDLTGGGFNILDARLINLNNKAIGGIRYFIDEYDNIVISGCDDNIEELIIPEEIEGKPVKIIYTEAFLNHTKLKTISMPNSIVEIGDRAFKGCTGLTSVVIPNGISTLNPSLFEECVNLTTVVIPNSVVNIRDWAFVNCSSLTSVTLPNGVHTIAAGAFAGCTGLKGITLSNNVTTIGEYAFANCYDLIIYGYNNSVAQQYAKGHDIRFIDLDLPVNSVQYSTHVQSYGWETDWKNDGEMSGTSGEAKRLEAIKIKLDNTTLHGGIEYRTHVQTYGWLGWTKNGAMSGTEGEAKRLEAIQIRLTGELSEVYDVYYRVHAQSYGWLGWAKNGACAGTAGYAKRLEAIEIVLVEKGGAAPGSTANAYVEKLANVNYRTHVQSYGWEKTWAKNGAMSGTEGEAKRLEAIQIMLDGQFVTGNIEYRTHVQTLGWLGWVKNGAMSGTEGLAKRLEAIQIRLTGEMAQKYDIYYRVHAQSYGWLGWAKNGESAGTEGLAKRLEGIEIVLVKKGEAAPGSTANYFIKK